MIPCLLLSIIASTALAPGAAADAQTIARRMIEAERRLTPLEIRYIVDVPVQPGERLRQTELYRRQLTESEPLEFHDYEYVMYKDDQKPRRASSRVESFDGKHVMLLNREQNDNGLMSGLISQSQDDRDRAFKQGTMHARVWGFGSAFYGDWILRDDSDIRVVGKEAVGGVETIVLAGTVFSKQGALRVWVAPSRGYLPLRAEVTAADGAAPFTATELSDLKEVAPGVWYPAEVLAGKPGASPADEQAFIRYRLNDISLAPLDQRAFRIEFPPDALVTDRVLGMSYTTLGAGEDQAGIGSDETMQDIARATNPEAGQQALDAYLESSPQEARKVGEAFPVNPSAAAATGRHRGYSKTAYWWAMTAIGLAMALAAVVLPRWARSKGAAQ